MNRPLRHPLPAEQVDYRARFTADEFVRMMTAGAFDDMKVELIGGELERMNPPMTRHSQVQGDVFFALRTTFAGDSEVAVFVDVGIAIDAHSVLAGDAVVARATKSANRLLDASEVRLVVEVAASTLSRDLGVKRLAYAAAGIPHYWVVDTERQVTHVYGDPVAGDYAEIATVRFGAPLAVPGSARTITLD